MHGKDSQNILTQQVEVLLPEGGFIFKPADIAFAAGRGSRFVKILQKKLTSAFVMKCSNTWTGRKN